MKTPSNYREAVNAPYGMNDRQVIRESLSHLTENLRYTDLDNLTSMIEGLQNLSNQAGQSALSSFESNLLFLYRLHHKEIGS